MVTEGDSSENEVGLGQVGYRMRGDRGGEVDGDLEGSARGSSNGKGSSGKSDCEKSGVFNGSRLLCSCLSKETSESRLSSSRLER